MANITMKEMLETGVHFGHQTRRWNPKMRPYIFGSRKGIHIIDLQQTMPLFERAYNFLVNVVANKGKVLFVGTKRQAQDIIQEEAERSDQYYITTRWMGGTLTNFSTIKHSVERMKKLESRFEDGSIHRFPKKEVVHMERELTKLRRTLGGIRSMEDYPQAGFIVDPKREEIAIREFNRLGIPIVAVTDTNCDPDVVDYVIPGNDDAIRAIKLFTSRVADACLEGAAHQEEFVEESSQQAAQQTQAVPEEAAAEEQSEGISREFGEEAENQTQSE
jgi:small subunit ribosomal protein S2